MTKEFDPNDAPEGYRAVKTTDREGISCAACAFAEASFEDCAEYPCISSQRADENFAIFVRLKRASAAISTLETIQVWLMAPSFDDATVDMMRELVSRTLKEMR